MSQRNRVHGEIKFGTSTQEAGPEVLVSNTTNELKYQLRITKEMMRFIREEGYNPLVDRTKILNVSMKLLPKNDKEEEALKFFLKAKKDSERKAKKHNYKYPILAGNARPKKNYSFAPITKPIEGSDAYEALQEKKKAATKKVTA